jgi:hypothetical protein
VSHPKRLVLRLAIALAVGFGLACFNGPKLIRLARHGVRGRAVVTHTDCGRHNSFSYDVVVEAPAARPTGRPFVPADCWRLRKGDTIDVYYLPDDPATSSAREPRAALRNEAIFVAMAGLFVSTFAMRMMVGPRALAREYGAASALRRV